MKLLKLIIIISISIGLSKSYAQQINFNSTVINSNNGEPVPYANIQKIGSYQGTATNESGEFSILLNKQDSILISCIGFKSIKLNGTDTLLQINLEPESLILDEVLIRDKNVNGAKIVKKAIKAIKNNYISEPVTLNTFYRHYCKDDTVYGRLIEAAVDLYKSKGYGKPKDFELKKDFRQLKQIRRSFDNTVINANHIPIAFDQVMNLDFVSYQSNSYEPSPFMMIGASVQYVKRNFKNYLFEYEKHTTINEKRVYIINYESTPWYSDILETGIPINMTHTGQLYIEVDNLAIIKITSHFKIGKFSTTHDEIYYRETGNKYVLSHIIHESNSKSSELGSHTAHIEILVNDTKIGKDRNFKDVPFTEEVLNQNRYDSLFWNSYQVIVENPLEKQIRTQLSKGIPLSDQFIQKAEQDSKIWMEQKSDQNELEKIIAQNTGQIIYLDFWASWCSPCISEFIKSASTVKEYENKGVKFIYISIDNNVDHWLKLKERYGLANKKHLRIGNQSDFSKKYKISEIPRYMMLSIDGKLIEYAPRPSSAEFKTLVSSELNKLEKELGRAEK